MTARRWARWLAACLFAACLIVFSPGLGGTKAAAQPRPAPPPPQAPAPALTLPEQPSLVGPRLLKITQVDARNQPIGPVVDVLCPATGCQENLVLTYEGVEERFTAAIEVVGRGVYIALTSRAVGIAQIVEFQRGAPGPAFIAMRGRVQVRTTLRFGVQRDASVRAERGPDPGGNVTTGQIYVRRRVPDIYLMVEISAPEG